jgi:hypothetical protein
MQNPTIKNEELLYRLDRFVAKIAVPIICSILGINVRNISRDNLPQHLHQAVPFRVSGAAVVLGLTVKQKWLFTLTYIPLICF